jgi:hypothetical protein
MDRLPIPIPKIPTTWAVDQASALQKWVLVSDPRRIGFFQQTQPFLDDGLCKVDLYLHENPRPKILPEQYEGSLTF